MAYAKTGWAFDVETGGQKRSGVQIPAVVSRVYRVRHRGGCGGGVGGGGGRGYLGVIVVVVVVGTVHE